MGALGMSQGKRFKLHPPTIEFARLHGVEIKAWQAGDAKRKGKIERPFRDLGESFLEEFVVTGVPADLNALNLSAVGWIDERVHRRVHRSTHARPIDRFDAESDFLGGLPRQRFDTDYVETRRVHRALPFIEWKRVRYSVLPACLGQLVEVRHAVDSNVLNVRAAGRLVATHQLVSDGRNEIWDPEHRRVAEAAALASTRPRHLHIVTAPSADTTAAGAVGRLELPGGDFDVAAPDLAARYDHQGPA